MASKAKWLSKWINKEEKIVVAACHSTALFEHPRVYTSQVATGWVFTHSAITLAAFCVGELITPRRAQDW